MGAKYLNDPFDVAFARNGDLLVADQDCHRICVLSSDTGEFTTSFGACGTEAGNFMAPMAMAVSGGRLYVMDSSSPRVQVFQ